MRVLLDTHALLWATLDPTSLSQKASRIIADHDNLILVSAASAWEISTKVRLGRLRGAERLEREFLDVMDGAGYTLVSIAAAVALRAGRFTSEHRDPFGRVIAAKALHDDIPVLSSDENWIHFMWNGFGKSLRQILAPTRRISQPAPHIAKLIQPNQLLSSPHCRDSGVQTSSGAFFPVVLLTP